MIEDPMTAESGPDDRASVPQGRPYLAMVKLVEDLFATHGDSHRGLGYSNENGFHDRYRAYLDVTRFGPPVQAPVRVLDIGCATGRLLDHIKASTRTDIVYRGVDLSATILDKARDKHPKRISSTATRSISIISGPNSPTMWSWEVCSPPGFP